VLVDPGDVRKLDVGRLRAGRAAIGRLPAETDVVVSANRAETGVLADAFDGESERPFEEAARAAFDALDPTWFVGHGIDRSVVVTSGGSEAVAVPAVDDPELTTSSGDHFNAGLALGALTGLDPAASVVVGNSVAGHFVRTGGQPSLAEIRAFVDGYLERF
jgi:sugar/nucleoside kinase (ribokinase family)